MKYQKFLCALPLAFILFSLNYVKENENKKDLDTNIIVSLKEYQNLSKEEVSGIFYQEFVCLIVNPEDRCCTICKTNFRISI